MMLWISFAPEEPYTKITFFFVSGSMKGLTACQRAQKIVGASYM